MLTRIRCQMFHLNCTEFNFGCRPALPRPIAGFGRRGMEYFLFPFLLFFPFLPFLFLSSFLLLPPLSLRERGGRRRKEKIKGVKNFLFPCGRRRKEDRKRKGRKGGKRRKGKRKFFAPFIFSCVRASLKRTFRPLITPTLPT